jgi:hypothetical protein
VVEAVLPSVRRSMAIALLLGCVSVGVRLAVLRGLREGSWSTDLNSWLFVAQVLREARNPYNETSLLNWPPMWMQVLSALDHVSQLTHVRLVRVIQGFLIGLEGLLTYATYLLLARYWRVQRAWLLVLVGLVLNPVAILLTTVHGNFDLIVGAMVVLFLWAITRWQRHGQLEDWLLACLFLGVAILAKTAPLVLVPLLLIGRRPVTWRLRLVGGVLTVGPVTLGMSIILSLGPSEVVAHVVRYRSVPGFFGISGILGALNWPANLAGLSTAALTAYATAFLALLVCIAVLLVFWIVRSPQIPEGHVVLITAALLALVPVLGPGYAPQYAWWWLPTMVLAFALGEGLLRLTIVMLYAIAAVTYAAEYSLVPSLGEILLRWPHPAGWDILSQQLSTPRGQTYLRLPLFATYVAFLAVTGIVLHRGSTTPTGARCAARTDLGAA